jgi:hypothetical protein
VRGGGRFQPPEIGRAIRRLAREPNGGLLALPGSPGMRNRDLIVNWRHGTACRRCMLIRNFFASLISYDGVLSAFADTRCPLSIVYFATNGRLSLPVQFHAGRAD